MIASVYSYGYNRLKGGDHVANLRDWIPDSAVEELTVRRALSKVEDPIKLAVDILRENLPLSTMSMVHLATNSPTEAIRFQAAKYVMDRTLGDGKDLKLPDNKPAWEKIYDTVLVEVDNITKNENM